MPRVDWSKYGYGQHQRPAGSAGPPRPPFPPSGPLLQIGPAPGQPADLPVALTDLARQALANRHLDGKGPANDSGPDEWLSELEYQVTEEQVTAVGTRCGACGLVQGPSASGGETCRRCRAATLTPLTLPLPLTMFDLLVSSGLARSPGKAALLLRHRAVEIDGQVVAQEPVPLRHGSIIATSEGLQARIAFTEPPHAQG